MSAIKVGDPLDPATEIGSMITAEHQAHVLGYIATGDGEGARILAWRRPSRRPARAISSPRRCSIEVEPTMTIAREEIFGPVLGVMTAASGGGAEPRRRTPTTACMPRLHPRHRSRASIARAPALRHGVGQQIHRGRHQDALRRLPPIRLAGPRQRRRGDRPVFADQDDLDRRHPALTPDAALA